MAAERVTSVAVAERAGVSQSTVSLVLSGKARGRVSEATAAAVRRAADELGYRPNRAARALRMGAARMVCLVVPDVTNPFFGQVLRGAAHAADDAGFEVALVDVGREERPALESFSALAAGPSDGFLLFGLVPPAGERTDRIVLVEREEPGLASVRFRFEDAVVAAVDHLVALGHTRIGHISAAVGEPVFAQRVAAADAAVAAAGLEPITRVRSAINHVDATKVARDLLARPGRPTAVLCDDDIIAAGAGVAARELGLRVPADVSLVGCDDLPVASVVDPPLTTLVADGHQLGAAAFELLAEVLDGGHPSPRRLPVELVVRGSTGPAPALPA